MAWSYENPSSSPPLSLPQSNLGHEVEFLVFCSISAIVLPEILYNLIVIILQDNQNLRACIFPSCLSMLIL